MIGELVAVGGLPLPPTAIGTPKGLRLTIGEAVGFSSVEPVCEACPPLSNPFRGLVIDTDIPSGFRLIIGELLAEGAETIGFPICTGRPRGLRSIRGEVDGFAGPSGLLT